MQHIYENKTNGAVSVILASEDNTTANARVFGPHSRLVLSYPGLDMYVPHSLTKICEHTGKYLVNSNQIKASIPVVEAPTLLEAPIEEVPAEEVPAEEVPVPVEEAPIEEVPAEETKKSKKK